MAKAVENKGEGLGEEMPEGPPQEIDSKYRLIILAAQRSKQLQRGARARVELDDARHKLTRVALEEVSRGHVAFETVDVE